MSEKPICLNFLLEKKLYNPQRSVGQVVSRNTKTCEGFHCSNPQWKNSFCPYLHITKGMGKGYYGLFTLTHVFS